MSTILETGDVIKLEQAAKLLNCSTGTIRNLIKRGEIPAIRMGIKMKGIRVHKSDVEKFVDRQRIKTEA